MKNRTQLNVALPRETKRRLRKRLLDEGISLRAWLLQQISTYLSHRKEH